MKKKRSYKGGIGRAREAVERETEIKEGEALEVAFQLKKISEPNRKKS